MIAGNTLTITYLSGLTSYVGESEQVDALGYTNFIPNGRTGGSGGVFPSQYTPADWNTYLYQLFGTFIDATETIVSTPFAVGLGRTVTIPVGATRLQLGLNDDYFSDNIGSLNIQVQDQGQATPVPENQPLTILGVITALGLGSGLKRKSR